MENHQALRKRKTHRRKPGGKRKKDKIDRSMETCSDEHNDGDVPSSHTEETREDNEPQRKQLRVISQNRHPHQFLRTQKFGPRRLLRPANVPQAPQNSTQFIIDDHENSAYFIDFEKGFTSPSTRDDVGWSPYFEQDFENVYRTTREAEVIDWTQEVLIQKISSLEERVKTLEQQLPMCDPNLYASQLQHRLIYMQDENRHLKEFRIWCPLHGKKVRLRTSVSDSASGSCSSSSSESDDDHEERSQSHNEEMDNGFSEDAPDDSVTTEDEKVNHISDDPVELVEKSKTEAKEQSCKTEMDHSDQKEMRPCEQMESIGFQNECSEEL